MLPIRYIAAVFNRAAQGSVLLTDRLSILVVPFATLVLWIAGTRMTGSVSETLAIGVASTVVAVVILRLLAATYFLWKADQAEKLSLKATLDIERARPDKLQREAARAHVINLRNQLGAVLASHVSYAELRAKAPKGSEPFEALYESDYLGSFRKVRDILNSLSYDVPLRVVCHELHHKCSRIISQGISTNDEDFEILQSLKKIAFRLIFKADNSEAQEFLCLIEAENLLGKMQSPDGALADLQRLVKDNPEVLSKLRSNV